MWSPSPPRLWPRLLFTLYKFTVKLYSWRQSLHISLNTKKPRWQLTGVLFATDKCSCTEKDTLHASRKERVKPQSSYKTLHLQWWPDCIICWCNTGTNTVAVTRHYLIEFKDYSTRFKSYLTLLSWPRIELDRSETWKKIKYYSSAKGM